MVPEASSINPDKHSNGGRYLYADYTVFEQNSNFINLIKDFVMLSNGIARVNRDRENLYSAIQNSDVLKNDIGNMLDSFRKTCSQTISRHYIKHNDSAFLALQPSGVDYLAETKNSLISMLAATERRFLEHHSRYRKYLNTKVSNTNRNAIRLLESWLLNSHDLPNFITTKVNSFQVGINSKDNKTYRIVKKCSVEIREKSGSISPDTEISYSITINSSSLEFWNYKKRVSDLSLGKFRIPIGFRMPLTRKFKLPMKLISARNKISIEKEPEYVDINKYYIISAKTEDESILLITLVSDPSRPERDAIKISCNVKDIQDQKTLTESMLHTRFPIVDYVTESGKTVSNIVRMEELVRYLDMTKIMKLCHLIFDKIRDLTVQRELNSISKLETLNIIYNKDNNFSENSGKNVLQNEIEPYYSPELSIVILESIAKGLAPTLGTLRKKSTVNGEVILRHEQANGERKEYVVKINDLVLQLSASHIGCNLVKLLGLNNKVLDQSSHLTNARADATSTVKNDKTGSAAVT
jgi:hypothetical protein